MKNVKKILTLVFGVAMVMAGIMHFYNPGIYMPFVPNILPQIALIYLGGVAEIVVGLCTLTPRYRGFGTWGIFILMLAFLPLHVIDVFKDKPAIGSITLAYVRLAIQFVFIAWAWYILKRD